MGKPDTNNFFSAMQGNISLVCSYRGMTEVSKEPFPMCHQTCIQIWTPMSGEVNHEDVAMTWKFGQRRAQCWWHSTRRDT